MRKIKQIVSILLCNILLASLIAPSVFAAQSASVTINPGAEVRPLPGIGGNFIKFAVKDDSIWGSDSGDALVISTVSQNYINELKGLGIKMIRFPGGCDITDVASDTDNMRGYLTTNQFYMDRTMQLAEAIDADVLVSINISGIIDKTNTHTIVDACGQTDSARYTLEQITNFVNVWSTQRKTAGLKYVKYYELGNEEWGSSYDGAQLTPAMYVTAANEVATGIKTTFSDAKILGVTSRVDKTNYEGSVTPPLAENDLYYIWGGNEYINNSSNFDYLTFHHYWDDHYIEPAVAEGEALIAAETNFYNPLGFQLFSQQFSSIPKFQVPAVTEYSLKCYLTGSGDTRHTNCNRFEHTLYNLATNLNYANAGGSFPTIYHALISTNQIDDQGEYMMYRNGDNLYDLTSTYAFRLLKENFGATHIQSSITSDDFTFTGLGTYDSLIGGASMINGKIYGIYINRNPSEDVQAVFSLPNDNVISAISAGADYTCAIVNGSVQCWGLNDFGQTGNGNTNTPQLAPVTAITSGATAIATGANHTCAIVNGAVQCWGDKYFGQIGNGNTTTPQLTPFTVIASGATAIATGANHTCAIVNGAVQCWGNNYEGQTGSGNTITPQLAPVTAIASGATAISAGVYHTCAIVNGAVQCWGLNNFGQTGNGNTNTPQLAPVTAITSGATAISAGGYHTCAIVNGAVQCWGLNGFGQIGNGNTTTPQLTPFTVIASGATAISAAGGYHTCAIVNSAVQCWGLNESGQIGNGNTTTPQLTPFTVIASGATAIAAGLDHTCAIVNGSVQCWGLNESGQTGNRNTSSTQLTPFTAIEKGPDAASSYTLTSYLLHSTETTADAIYSSDLTKIALNKINDNVSEDNNISLTVPAISAVLFELTPDTRYLTDTNADGTVNINDVLHYFGDYNNYIATREFTSSYDVSIDYNFDKSSNINDVLRFIQNYNSIIGPSD